MRTFRSLAFLRISGDNIFHPALASERAGGKKRAAICALLAAMLWLSGCTALQVKLGWVVDLKKIPVASIEASLPKGPGIAPGDKSQLLVTIKRPDGKMFATEGTDEARVRWDDLAITATVVTVSDKGAVRLSPDPRVSDGKLPHVTITAPSHPDLRADLDIPLRYDRSFSATFSGPSGRSGWDGRDGTDGMSGSMGSTDPDHPSPGGSGSDGGDGTNGDDGGPGGDGPPVRVRVALRPRDPGPLLQVSVSSERTENLFLVDPHGGSLTVKSLGGAGGSGGRGGRGGRGGSGGLGIPKGSDGRNGSDGRSGLSGSSGKGGPIFVTYDAGAKAYLGAIHLSNPGGPAPILKEEPVGPLW